MIKLPKLSVIIPVYGVDKYIERCARSLFEQTLDDIEYLFIDDCTPDDSIVVLKRVLEEYPHRKQQVLIHKMERNSGQAAVREWGTRNAKGEYLIHCDSDDYIADNNAYQKLWKTIKEEKKDILFFDYNTVTPNGTFISAHKRQKIEIKESLLRYMLAKHTDYNPLWAALVKRELYSEPFVFPNNNQGEDGVIMAQLVYKADSYGFLEERLYNYCINPNSITNAIGEDAVLNRFFGKKANTDILLDFISKTEYSKGLSKELQMAKYKVRRVIQPILNKRKYHTMWRETYPEIDPGIIFNKYMSIKEKVKYMLIYLILK